MDWCKTNSLPQLVVEFEMAINANLTSTHIFIRHMCNFGTASTL